MKMKLADQTAAMLPLTPSGTAGALVIRALVILAALREYFEMLWDRATPLKPERSAPPAGRLTRAQQAVLQLMAEGLHDDAIARRAGISTTTVRRHIAGIMARPDVSSRFAAGAAAQTARMDRVGPSGIYGGGSLPGALSQVALADRVSVL
jgi:DNA-binding NarL/FixJ family response regulator